MNSKIKYILVPYIALGLVLSLLIGVEYVCMGDGASPTFYGSPFVFKQKSLVTSMEYYYSISGLLLNTMLWSALLYLLHFLISSIIKKTGNNKTLIIAYKLVVAGCIAFATLNIAVTTIFAGNGFTKNTNYWYFDMDKQATDWGMKCEREWTFFER